MLGRRVAGFFSSQVRGLKIALVGRPNVGKSTLFNRLSSETHKSHKAIVSDIPGTTRDRREANGSLGDVSYELTDTPGFELDSDISRNKNQLDLSHRELLNGMWNQTKSAISEANIAFFIVDCKSGLTAEDLLLASLIRKSVDDISKVCVIANKCDVGSVVVDAVTSECYQLGFGEPVFVSASQKIGFGDLYDIIKEAEEIYGSEHLKNKRRTKVAIVGRPNSGKSTIMNSILGEERVITGPMAGLTRDCVPVSYDLDGRPLTLFDTAGYKRPGRIFDRNNLGRTKEKRFLNAQYDDSIAISSKTEKKLDWEGVQDSLAAIDASDVVLYLIDAVEFKDNPDMQGYISKLDLHVMKKVFEAGKPLIVAANKCDLLNSTQNEEEFQYQKKEIQKSISEQLANTPFAAINIPVIAVSAQENRYVSEALSLAVETFDSSKKHIPTSKLNLWLEYVMKKQRPPSSRTRRGGGRRFLKFKFMNQSKSKPPVFSIFTNKRQMKQKVVPEAYRRYLLKELQAAFDFNGVPIEIKFKKSNS